MKRGILFLSLLTIYFKLKSKIGQNKYKFLVPSCGVMSFLFSSIFSLPGPNSYIFCCKVPYSKIYELIYPVVKSVCNMYYVLVIVLLKVVPIINLLSTLFEIDFKEVFYIILSYFVSNFQCIVGYRNWTANNSFHRSYWWCNEFVPLSRLQNICIWSMWCLC